MPAARMALYELSPITQRIASTRFDLPQPFGPTTPVSPGSIRNSEGSTKDLKPSSLSLVNCMHASDRARAGANRRSVTMLWRPSDGKPGTALAPEKRGLFGLDHRVDDLVSASDVASPRSIWPLMKKVGVALTPNFSLARRATFLDRLRKLLVGKAGLERSAR